jgi:hypothetical protein
MLADIVMGIEQDFQLAPAHANLNLIGSMLLFLFGPYCGPIPAAATSTQAKVQAWLPMAGAIIFPLGVVLVVLERVPRSRLHRSPVCCW